MNTIAPSLDLDVGEISKAILNKAGRKIQEEIESKKRSIAKNGEIYVTRGYYLNCAEVYHTICASHSEPRAREVVLISVVPHSNAYDYM